MRPQRLVGGFRFLEGPRWRNGALWVSDMLAGSVFKIDLKGKIELVATVPERPSGLGFLPDGSLVIASMRDRCLIRRDADGSTARYADLSPLVAHEINDMVVDERGYAYVGAFGFAGAAAEAFSKACIVLARPGTNPEIVARDLAFPNGCAVLPAPRRLLVAETFGQRLTVFDIADDGRLHDRRVFADLGQLSPDGLCVDEEEGVWVAGANTPWFVRVTEGGAITDRVQIEGRQAVACALGGPDGRTLFCVTVAAEFEYNVPSEAASSQIDVVSVAVPAQGL
jgi:sugar lactone lactonase YvrE